jgi:hypothetical protein
MYYWDQVGDALSFKAKEIRRYKGLFSSSGFKTGSAQSHTNLAKRAFSFDTGTCDFGGRRF